MMMSPVDASSATIGVSASTDGAKFWAMAAFAASVFAMNDVLGHVIATLLSVRVNRMTRANCK